jgi:hypothetical protein
MWECLTKKMRQKNLKKKINFPSACVSTRGSDPSPSVRSVALGEGGVRLSGNNSLSRVSGGGSRGKPSRPDFPTAHLLNPSTLPRRPHTQPPPSDTEPLLRRRRPHPNPPSDPPPPPPPARPAPAAAPPLRPQAADAERGRGHRAGADGRGGRPAGASGARRPRPPGAAPPAGLRVRQRCGGGCDGVCSSTSPRTPPSPPASPRSAPSMLPWTS